MKIRYYRELRGLNQKELAALIGVSNSRVSNWEQGINRPDADIVASICHALQISADDLLDVKINNSAPGPSPEALSVAAAYDAASPAIQESVRKLLDVPSQGQESICG